MANVNFYGAEITSEGLGAVIDNINSYMGQPVVSDFVNNGVIDAENASYSWENFTPASATVTNIQDTIYRSAIDDENFGGSRCAAHQTWDDKGNTVTENECFGEDKHIWSLGEGLEDAAEEEEESPADGPEGPQA